MSVKYLSDGGVSRLRIFGLNYKMNYIPIEKLIQNIFLDLEMF